MVSLAAPDEFFIFDIVDVAFGADDGVLLDVRRGVDIPVRQIPVGPEIVIARQRHVEPAGYDFRGFLANFFGTDDEHGVQGALPDALTKFAFHEFISWRKNHVTLNSRHAGFCQQFFHAIFKFLAHQIIACEADDEDFLDRGHGDTGENPAKNDARAGTKGKRCKDEDGGKRD